jgi:hypothetical protein
MSVQAISWVLEHSQATKGARLVLFALANHAHQDGTNCWASVETLAKGAKLSERATQYALRQLEEMGEIVRTGTHHSGTRIYSIPGVQTLQGVQGESSETHVFAPKPLEPSDTTEERLRARNQSLVAHYVDHAHLLGVVLPDRVKGATAREVKVLVKEGHDERYIRRALELLTEKGLNPASLPSLVVEAQREGTNGKGLTAAQIRALPLEESA